MLESFTLSLLAYYSCAQWFPTAAADYDDEESVEEDSSEEGR